MYVFVNIFDKKNEDKEFVVSVLDGYKYKNRTALKFNKFEKQVMAFYFKRIRPLWISGLKLLNYSFSTWACVLVGALGTGVTRPVARALSNRNS